MSKLRFLSLLCLVWSIAFLLLPDFRESLQVPFRAYDWPALMRLGALSPGTLQAIATEGEGQQDARALAFVALHSPSQAESTRLADEAVKLDPQLTWIYYSLVTRHLSEGTAKSLDTPEIERWIAQLEAWDRGNALPYLLEAEQIHRRQAGSRQQPEELANLEKDVAWRQAMEKAFADPHYQTYAAWRFDLERDLIRRYKLDRPAVVLFSFISYPIPGSSDIRAYGNLLVNKLGKQAEHAGQLPEALDDYWRVAHFGEQMQLNGPTLPEKHIGVELQDTAYEQLLPLLRRLGRANEASTVEYARQQVLERLAILHGKDPLAQSNNYYWGALSVHLFAGLVIGLGLLTVVAIIYLTAKRWVRPEKQGRLYQMSRLAQTYLPIVVFLACLGLYLSYYPYAQNFHRYMSEKGEIHDFEPLFFNVFPSFFTPLGIQTPLQNPFRLYVWYALVGLALVVLVSRLSRHSASR